MPTLKGNTAGHKHELPIVRTGRVKMGKAAKAGRRAGWEGEGNWKKKPAVLRSPRQR